MTSLSMPASEHYSTGWRALGADLDRSSLRRFEFEVIMNTSADAAGRAATAQAGSFDRPPSAGQQQAAPSCTGPPVGRLAGAVRMDRTSVVARSNADATGITVASGCRSSHGPASSGEAK